MTETDHTPKVLVRGADVTKDGLRAMLVTALIWSTNTRILEDKLDEAEAGELLNQLVADPQHPDWRLVVRAQGPIRRQVARYAAMPEVAA